MDLSKDQLEGLAGIGQKIETQNNSCTSEPLFVVFQKRKITGLYSDFGDRWDWVLKDGDGVAADPKTAALLNGIQAMPSYKRNPGQEALLDKWARYGYIEVNVFCTACFTLEGAERHIELNGHNLKSPFIYVTSAHRNPEMIFIRQALRDFAKPDPTQEK